MTSSPEVRELIELDEIHWKTRRSHIRTMKQAYDAAREGIDVILRVESRCMACDGPVTPTLREITETEFSDVYLKLKSIADLLRPFSPQALP